MRNCFDVRSVTEYWLDAWQRCILSLDVLRQRGNIYQEQSAKEVPHVLSFQAELIRDGRTLPRPERVRVPDAAGQHGGVGRNDRARELQRVEARRVRAGQGERSKVASPQSCGSSSASLGTSEVRPLALLAQ